MGLMLLSAFLAYDHSDVNAASKASIAALERRQLRADVRPPVLMPSPSALPNAVLAGVGSPYVTTVLDLSAMIAAAPPAPQAHAAPDSIANAAQLRAPLPDGARAPDVFYGRSQGGYQCKPLGRLEFQRPTNIGTVADRARIERRGVQSSGSRLSYGEWRVAYPRFLLPEHEAWFFRYEIQRQRWER